MNNLNTETALKGLTATLEDRILPALAHDPFATEQARLSWVLLGLIAGQVDGLAAIRVADNGDMRALFGDAAGLVEAPLADQLRAAAASRDPGYRISQLDAENGRLRSLLVTLHAALEQRDSGEARAMHTRIWRLLRDVEERRG